MRISTLLKILTKNGPRTYRERRENTSYFLFLSYYLVVLTSSLISIAVPNNFTFPSFCIPGLPLLSMMEAEANATNASSAGRRMKVYLPLLPNSIKVKHPTTDKNSINEREDRKNVSSSSPTFDEDAYPSPSRSSSKSLSFTSQGKRVQNYMPQRPQHAVSAVAPYRPPSPPTSDLPIPSDATDVHLEVDFEGIQFRYPEMKRLSRKVLCSHLLRLYV